MMIKLYAVGIFNVLIFLILFRVKKLNRNIRRLIVAILILCFISTFLVINQNPNLFKSHNYRNISSSQRSPGHDQVRVFCMVLTDPRAFKTYKLNIVHDVWVKHCDDYRFLTVIPDKFRKNSTIKVMNETIEIDKPFKLLQPSGITFEEYGRLTKKMYATIRDIYKSYGNYDWYLKADHDTFINIEHLKEFLSDKNPSQPVTYGFDFKVYVPEGYHSGGGGYVLSHEALKRLGTELNKTNHVCEDYGIEDVNVAGCLRKLGVYPNKSSDKLNRERFHPLSVYDHYKGNLPDWMFSYVKSNYSLRSGPECCSDTLISFHYMSPEDMVLLKKAIEVHKNNTRFNHGNSSFKEIYEIYDKLNKNSKR